MPLRKGEGSMTIKQKQWQLYYLGYYGGEIDGIWGAGSKADTVSFQKDNSVDAKLFELSSGWLLCQIMSKTHKMRYN